MGSGDLYQGFPRVTAQLWKEGNLLPEQFLGSLPPAPHLVELCRNWQSNYQSLCDRQQLLSITEDDDELEIDADSVTNVSVSNFNNLCHKLQLDINQWLSSDEYLNISRQLRSHLHQREEIRVMMETNDDLLRRLPWHRYDFYRDYPRAEMALCQSEYKQAKLSQRRNSHKVRILAVLGNSKGIDLEAETRFLLSLPDAEVVLIVNPTRQELNTQLWDVLGWDILFFAGHSRTEGKTGRIYINENKTNNSLTIEQLEEALKAAIEKGLQLAIFNSCDGLGLALALENLHIPSVIVMREPVPNLVAQEFFKYFLQAFALERLSFYLAVQQARRKLQGLEDDFPGASWLPVICINPAVEPPTWLKLGGIPPCPYRGLFAFREEDAHLFKGREQFTQRLLRAVKTKPLVAVVGSSGSGKSSVVFAGLIPQLRLENNVRWQIVWFRPGNNPIEALAVALVPEWHSLITEASDHSAGFVAEPQNQHRTGNMPIPQDNDDNQRLLEMELEIALRQDKKALSKVIEKIVQRGDSLLLIADQFEELYTLSSESERQFLLDALLTASDRAPNFTLVLTLRADFFGHSLSYRPLSDALQGAVQNLGPMSRQELRKVIEEPAAQMQVGLEKELTNKLIYDFEEQSGSLPLLEFALTELWSKQKYGLLTHQAYEEIGGVEEALANHAEEVYKRLDETQRHIVPRIFVQLVRPGEGTEDTRRIATRAEVGDENWELVSYLAGYPARLVVTGHDEKSGEDTVEVVHEALIREWLTLREWMNANRQFRVWQERLKVAVVEWKNSNYDTGALLRGVPLGVAQEWLHKRVEEMTPSEQNFINASLQQRFKEQQELERRRRRNTNALISVLVTVLILLGFALSQWHLAEKQRLNAANEEILAQSVSTENLFASGSELDALLSGLKAGKNVKKYGDAVDSGKRTKAIASLQQVVYGVKEHNRLEGHSGTVNSVVFSPDGKTIASASADNTVKLWNLSGQVQHTLRGHSGSVYTVVFSPDGKTIASASADNTVKLWNLSGQVQHTLKGHSDVVISAVFSPDGQTIASASADKTIKLWNLSGQELHTLKGHSDWVTSVVFSPDGKTIASASWDKTIKLWNLSGQVLHTLKGHSRQVNSVVFSPDGQTIASGSSDKTVRLWNLSGQELLSLKGHSDVVISAVFSPDGQTIASASWDKTVKLWNLSGQVLHTLKGHSSAVQTVVFSPDGQTIASGSSDNTVRLWNLSQQEQHTLKRHSATVTSVVFSPDGQTIATGSYDKTVKLWNLSGLVLHTLKGHNATVTSVVFSPDGQTIATGSVDKTVKLWSLSGQVLHTLKGHSGYVYSVVFSPDGQTIATGSYDKTVKLWNLSGLVLHTLKGHSATVTSVVFSPDGQTIATGSVDKTVKLWSLSGQLLHTFKGHSSAVNSVVFSPDGQTIATGSVDKTVKLWNLSGQELLSLKGHSATVTSVVFSPDGKTIASGSEDNTVKLWNLSGQEQHIFKGHSDIVLSVVFSPDGKTIASGSEDNTVRLWNMDFDDLVRHGCNWAYDYLNNNPNVKDDRHLCDDVLNTK